MEAKLPCPDGSLRGEATKGRLQDRAPFLVGSWLRKYCLTPAGFPQAIRSAQVASGQEVPETTHRF